MVNKWTVMRCISQPHSHSTWSSLRHWALLLACCTASSIMYDLSFSCVELYTASPDAGICVHQRILLMSQRENAKTVSLIYSQNRTFVNACHLWRKIYRKQFDSLDTSLAHILPQFGEMSTHCKFESAKIVSPILGNRTFSVTYFFSKVDFRNLSFCTPSYIRWHYIALLSGWKPTAVFILIFNVITKYN